MDVIQKIAEVADSSDDWHLLDTLHVQHTHEAAGPAAKFGLGLELYLENIDRSIMRVQSRQFFSDFQRLFPQRINQYLPEEQRRTVKINNNLDALIDADFGKSPIKSGYSASLFGAADIGIPKDDIKPYQAHALIGREGRKKPSLVSAFMPICNDQGGSNLDVLLKVFLRWCTLFKPLHGSAGLAFIFASGMSQNSAYTLTLMKRFPGFDYINGIDFMMAADSIKDRIKCINWLTVLCDDLIAQLGGLDHLKSTLRSQCSVHEYEGGVVIQAGVAPQIGDSQNKKIPEAYRAAAKLTAPIRFENYTHGLFRVPDNVDQRTETLSWIRRFD